MCTRSQSFLHTTILILGFLSIINIGLSLWTTSDGILAGPAVRLKQEEEEVEGSGQQGRMVEIVGEVFDAINTIESKYFLELEKNN